MSSIKLFEQFINELNLSTWQSASDKAREMGRNELSNKFKDKFFSEVKRKYYEKEKERRSHLLHNIEITKNSDDRESVLSKYIFNYYIEQYTSGSSDYRYNKNVDIIINDDFTVGYSYMFVMLYMNLDREEELREVTEEIWGDNLPNIDVIVDSFDVLESTPIRIDIIKEPPYIINSYNPKHKFANKDSILNFLDTLLGLYNIDNKEGRLDIIYKLNDFMGERPQVENGPFYEFIKGNFGSWEEFINKLDIRKLYK